MTGSCCLAMCHVARGWATCYFEYDVGGLWDVCAGIVIVQEAGGVVVTPDDGVSLVPCKSGKQKLSCGNSIIVRNFLFYPITLFDIIYTYYFSIVLFDLYVDTYMYLLFSIIVHFRLHNF